MGEEEKNNMGVDLADFLDFYLLDSHEQIDKLGAGLLRLEREGNNIALINDLFRSAHSLKGASGTMGFTPIVSLTHAAEDLLDRLRQGQMEVSMPMVDVLLALTDRVKDMLAQVEKREDISMHYDDLVSEIKSLISGEKTVERGRTETAEQLEEPFPDWGFTPMDFALTDEERERVKSAQQMGHGVYQVEAKFAENTLMKAVRAVMVLQNAQTLGEVIKMQPGAEEMEALSPESFAMLLISDEPLEEIKGVLMDVSEIDDIRLHPFTFHDKRVPESLGQNVAGEYKTYSIAEEITPNPEPILVDVATPFSDKEKASSKPCETTNNQTPTGEGNAPVHTIRVDTARMDNLINLVGEIVITRTRLVQIGQDLKEQYGMDPMISNLNETNVYLGRLMNNLQESAMKLRMVPIGTVFSRFPRLVRDLARKTGKEIDLDLRGVETELDKTVVEVIGDPLMHLIRNSVDHGIELPEERRTEGKPDVGKITLDAFHEGNHITILVSDDGKGLNLKAIRQKAIEQELISEREELSEREIANLIFLPGFSTAKEVTDISGRGVGMDVVKKALNSLGGMIDITTRQGKGTTFTIRLPLTLAIIQALLVEVGQEVYAIPLSSVLETLLVKKEEIKTVGGLPMVQLRGNTLPLISLQEKFDLPDTSSDYKEVFVVVVGLADKALGLIVDALRGQQEIVIKSLGDLLSNLPGIAGATILGDGKVTLILDVGGLIQDILVSRIG